MWLSKRREAMLIKLVELYISTHQPVNSSQMERFFPWAGSTIRKELQELESQKYLEKLHVSSGRIPSNKGLKFYINRILAQREHIACPGMETPVLRGSDFIDISMKLLSDLSTSTHNLGFILLGSVMEFNFKKIRFIKLSPYKLLAVIRSDHNWNYTKSFFTSRNYSPSELAKWARTLNQDFADSTLSIALKKIRNRIFKDRARYLAVYQGLYQLLKSRDLLSAELISRGEENIFNFGINSQAEMKQLLLILEEKERFAAFVDDLLHKSHQSTEPVVVFGSEQGISGLNQLMVVLAGFFSRDKRRLGNIGMIGPRYMEYPNVFSRLHHLSNYFSTEFVNH